MFKNLFKSKPDYSKEDVWDMERDNLLEGVTVTLTWEDWAYFMEEINGLSHQIENACTFFVSSNDTELTLCLSWRTEDIYKRSVLAAHSKRTLYYSANVLIVKVLEKESDHWYDQYLDSLYSPAVRI